jgi:hypothetical protein
MQGATELELQHPALRVHANWQIVNASTLQSSKAA